MSREVVRLFPRKMEIIVQLRGKERGVWMWNKDTIEGETVIRVEIEGLDLLFCVGYVCITRSTPQVYQFPTVIQWGLGQLSHTVPT